MNTAFPVATQTICMSLRAQRRSGVTEYPVPDDSGQFRKSGDGIRQKELFLQKDRSYRLPSLSNTLAAGCARRAHQRRWYANLCETVFYSARSSEGCRKEWMNGSALTIPAPGVDDAHAVMAIPTRASWLLIGAVSAMPDNHFRFAPRGDTVERLEIGVRAAGRVATLPANIAGRICSCIPTGALHGGGYMENETQPLYTAATTPMNTDVILLHCTVRSSAEPFTHQLPGIPPKYTPHWVEYPAALPRTVPASCVPSAVEA